MPSQVLVAPGSCGNYTALTSQILVRSPEVGILVASKLIMSPR